jgi:erythrocyte band 7 integral membrane protein
MTDYNATSSHDVERQAATAQRSRDEKLTFDQAEGYDCCSYFLIIVSYVLVIITFPFTFFMYFRIVQQYERAVIFRLGRLKQGGAVGPGLFFIIPCIDDYKQVLFKEFNLTSYYRKIDLRVVSFQVPPQEILSKDSVTVEVDAVVYFRIFDAIVSVVNVENAIQSVSSQKMNKINTFLLQTKLLAQTTLRTTLGTKTLAEMLSHRKWGTGCEGAFLFSCIRTRLPSFI